MKAFIDRVFKMKKLKKDQATETAVEAIIEEVKQDIKDETIYAKPGHYFPDCNCFKCVRWRQQNA